MGKRCAEELAPNLIEPDVSVECLKKKCRTEDPVPSAAVANCDAAAMALLSLRKTSKSCPLTKPAIFKPKPILSNPAMFRRKLPKAVAAVSCEVTDDEDDSSVANWSRLAGYTRVSMAPATKPLQRPGFPLTNPPSTYLGCRLAPLPLGRPLAAPPVLRTPGVGAPEWMKATSSHPN